MSDKRIITRRSVLGSLGVAGAGAALGGVGTQAFFSDQETFEDNQLVAGSLDMKVDWEEHYSDWSEDETEGVDYQMLNTSEEVPNGFKGYPQLRNQSLAINESDVDQFMNNTAIEAFPDANGDNLVDRGGIACEDFGDVPDDLEAPVINLDDVKPGDFGEVTFSFHICDNPGYVWMNGELTADEEVSVTEPEADDPDEDNVPGGTFEDGDGELAESVQAAVWYDNDCSNTLDESVGSADVVMAVDRSGSLDSDEWDAIKTALESAIDQFNGPDTVGLVFFGDAPQAVDWTGNGDFLLSVGPNRQQIADALPDSPPPDENATHMPGGSISRTGFWTNREPRIRRPSSCSRMASRTTRTGSSTTAVRRRMMTTMTSFPSTSSTRAGRRTRTGRSASPNWTRPPTSPRPSKATIGSSSPSAW
jgi:predicted ribosomally synthesized peptide with SipW-like signal peptide